MNEEEGTLLYSLTSNLARSAKSVGAKRYSASMKSSGTLGDEDLQEAVAKEPNGGQNLTGDRLGLNLTGTGPVWFIRMELLNHQDGIEQR